MSAKPPTRDNSERTHDIHTTMYHARRASTRKRSRPSFLGVERSEQVNSAFAGAVSGIACALFVAPLDVVKARKQVQSLHKGATRYGGTLESLRMIYRGEGLAGLFRGLPPTVLGYVPSWSVYFTFYGMFKDELIGIYGKANAMPCTVASAVLAGSITNVFTNPFWVVRTRLQVQDHISRNPEYSGTIDAFRKIYRVEGFGAFYKGLGASLLGLSHVAVQFPIYETLKKRFMAPADSTLTGANPGLMHYNWHRIGVLIFSSTLSKIVATVLTYPHDIARARLHIEKAPPSEAWFRGKSPLMRISVFRMIATIASEEGFVGLYQGLSTQLLRVTPACAVTFTSFEVLYSYLNGD